MGGARRLTAAGAFIRKVNIDKIMEEIMKGKNK